MDDKANLSEEMARRFEHVTDQVNVIKES